MERKTTSRSSRSVRLALVPWSPWGSRADSIANSISVLNQFTRIHPHPPFVFRLPVILPLAATLSFSISISFPPTLDPCHEDTRRPTIKQPHKKFIALSGAHHPFSSSSVVAPAPARTWVRIIAFTSEERGGRFRTPGGVRVFRFRLGKRPRRRCGRLFGKRKRTR